MTVAPEWKDETTRSRAERDKAPNAWAAEAFGVRVYVTNADLYHRPDWCVRIATIQDAPKRIGGPDMTADEARAAAIAWARAELTEKADRFTRAAAAFGGMK